MVTSCYGDMRIYPNEKIELQTAVAARVNIGSCVTVASVYISRAHDLTYDRLSGLIQQLPQPILLLGDFNSYYEMWEVRKQTVEIA